MDGAFLSDIKRGEKRRKKKEVMTEERMKRRKEVMCSMIQIE
jgi:hypothetical protein